MRGGQTGRGLMARRTAVGATAVTHRAVAAARPRWHSRWHWCPATPEELLQGALPALPEEHRAHPRPLVAAAPSRDVERFGWGQPTLDAVEVSVARQLAPTSRERRRDVPREEREERGAHGSWLVAHPPRIPPDPSRTYAIRHAMAACRARPGTPLAAATRALGVKLALSAGRVEIRRFLSSGPPPDRATELWTSRGLTECQKVAEALQKGKLSYRYLDAAQLLKHALGLATQLQDRFALVYLYCDSPCAEAKVHRKEIDDFAGRVGAELRFRAMTYQQLLSDLAGCTVGEPARRLDYARRRYVVSPQMQSGEKQRTRVRARAAYKGGAGRIALAPAARRGGRDGARV